MDEGLNQGKHTVTYSIIKLKPGFLLLRSPLPASRGLFEPSLPTNPGLFVAEIVLFISSAIVFIKDYLITLPLCFALALFLNWNQRKMNRDWIQIDGRHVTGRWKRFVNDLTIEVDYAEPHLAIDIHTWEEKFETGNLRAHGAVRVRMSSPKVPNILIAESQVRGFKLAPNANAILHRLRKYLQPEE